jgi:guanylate kinase
MADQKPRLANKAEFESILKDYRPSDASIRVLRSTKTVYMIGPTASGRNTLINELIKTGKYRFILSNTTRPRRMLGDRLEHDGETYWHITEDQFLRGLQDGKYIEAAIIHGQQVSGGYIGEYQKAQDNNLVAITDMEGLYGPPVIHSYSPEALFIFILPPTFEEWITRLQNRGKMSSEELAKRLQTAQKEIAAALERDYYSYIISSDLQANALAVHAFITNGVSIDTDQQMARDHAEQLLIDVRLYLESMAA